MTNEKWNNNTLIVNSFVSYKDLSYVHIYYQKTLNILLLVYV